MIEANGHYIVVEDQMMRLMEENDGVYRENKILKRVRDPYAKKVCLANMLKLWLSLVGQRFIVPKMRTKGGFTKSYKTL